MTTKSSKHIASDMLCSAEKYVIKMPAYKDNKTNSWYTSFRYVDWTGNKKQKLKRGFTTKREAKQYEEEYKRVAHANMDMTLESFVEVWQRLLSETR